VCNKYGNLLPSVLWAAHCCSFSFSSDSNNEGVETAVLDRSRRSIGKKLNKGSIFDLYKVDSHAAHTDRMSPLSVHRPTVEKVIYEVSVSERAVVIISAVKFIFGIFPRKEITKNSLLT